MCHLVLLAPVLGIAVFWLWPWPIAVTVYGVILAVSALVYKALLDAMHRPVVTGREGLLHEMGQVVEPSNDGWFVEVHGELWQATSSDELESKDRVEVVDVNGLTLRVRKAG